MNYDKPKEIQIIPPYAEVRGFSEIAAKDHAKNDYGAHSQERHETHPLEGYVIYSGTSISGTSGTIYQPHVIPMEGPILEVIIELDHFGQLLESKPEIRKK